MSSRATVVLTQSLSVPSVEHERTLCSEWCDLVVWVGGETGTEWTGCESADDRSGWLCVWPPEGSPSSGGDLRFGTIVVGHLRFWRYTLFL